MKHWLLTSLRGYRAGWLPQDLIAGLMLAAIAIPGQLATARLGGMPPETGLYAFAAGSVAFALFGANRFMSVAADSTIAPIFAGGLAALTLAGSASYVDMAAWLALMVGGVLLGVGLLRAGWLATLLSVPVTAGFLAGIAIHIMVGELPTLLGVPGSQGHLILRLCHTLSELGSTNPYTLLLGLGVLGVTIGTTQISPRLPGALFALVGAGATVALCDLGARGVSLLGVLSVQMPHIALPAWPNAHAVGGLIPLALVVAMVCIMQTAAVAGTFPSDEGKPDDVSRDFAGVGAGNILAGWLGSFAVDASPPSTAIVSQSGGRSQIASLTAVGLMILLALLGARMMAYLPHAALSGILIYIALRLFRIKEMINIQRHGGQEILLVAASAALVIAMPIATGMLLAIVLSFLHSLYFVARPYYVELERVPGSTVWWPPSATEHGEHVPGVLVFAPAAPISFLNAERICGAINQAIASRQQPVTLLVIEASGIIDLDYTGAQTLRAALAGLQARHITVAIARLSSAAGQVQAHRTGLIATVGEDKVFMSVEEAVRKLHHRV